MRPAVLLTLLALASATMAPSAASACSCISFPDFPTAYEQSHSIFLGEVTGIESAAPQFVNSVWVTFQVEGWWKGAPPATVRVLTGSSSAICGVEFVQGTRYLVYALLDGASGDLWTHICWRSHLYSPDDPDLDLLGPTPVATGSWGSLKIRYR